MIKFVLDIPINQKKTYNDCNQYHCDKIESEFGAEFPKLFYHKFESGFANGSDKFWFLRVVLDFFANVFNVCVQSAIV